MYCGDKVHGKPVENSDERVRMEYINAQTGKKAHLILYPFRRGEMNNLLREVGFTVIKQFSDYRAGEVDNAEFPAERHPRFGAPVGQFIEPRATSTREYQCQGLTGEAADKARVFLSIHDLIIFD